MDVQLRACVSSTLRPHLSPFIHECHCAVHMPAFARRSRRTVCGVTYSRTRGCEASKLRSGSCPNETVSRCKQLCST